MELIGGFQITTVIHCSYYTLFLSSLSPLSLSQAPPIIWLASSKLLSKPPDRYSLLPHRISRVLCPLSKNFQDLGLNQWALVAEGCIKKTMQHAQRHTYFMSKQCLDERIPAALNNLHAIRKHKVKVEVSHVLQMGIFFTAENYAANVFSAAGDEALFRGIIWAPDISIWEITEHRLICLNPRGRYHSLHGVHMHTYWQRWFPWCVITPLNGCQVEFGVSKWIRLCFCRYVGADIKDERISVLGETVQK